MQALGDHDLLMPVKPAFIVFSLIVAALANQLPWSAWTLWLRPDLVALVVLYWCIHEPRRVGFTTAFVFGLFMDVADGALLGQHALAYSLLAYGAIVMQRRVQIFPPALQVVYVIPLLLVSDLIVLAVRLVAGADFPGYKYFMGSLIGGALWPVVSGLLRLPQRRKSDLNHG
jgi:rod shape-determining protein MreD